MPFGKAGMKAALDGVAQEIARPARGGARVPR